MTGQVNFLQSLGWAVLNSLWQLALLWVIYQLITGMFRSAKPAARSLLASTLLMTGFAWFIYDFLSAYSSNSIKDGTISSIFNTEVNNSLSDWLRQTLPVASLFYLGLLVLPVLRFIRNYRYVQIIRKYGLSKINVEWRIFVGKVAAQMGIKKPVHIWVSELVSSPVTIGFIKPVILVPLAAINHLSTQQLEAVLLHELSHIRRSDYLINLIINLIQTILYFNPFVKALVKIVERERERSCDDMVLQFQYDSHEYASALLTLETVNHTEKPFALGAAGKKNDLLNRIESIMGIRKKQMVSFNKLAGVVAGIFCIIALNSMLIITRPNTAKGSSSYVDMASPVSFLDNETDKKPVAAAVENNSRTLVTHQGGTAIRTAGNISPAMDNELAETPGIIAAANFQPEETEAPQLKHYQEDQVKQAMESSKKVLENVQWKMVEKNIADVFTQAEKDQLRSAYDKELSKIDWNKWEVKLQAAYNKVDWDNVNEQLSNAVNMIRVDSLQKVYSTALCKIESARKELIQNKMGGIPDSDITLKELSQRQRELQKLNLQLRAVRAKKIVHL